MDDMDELEMELDAPNDNGWNEESFQRRMDTVSNASSKLGALLLQGWTMLADECQKCHTPLMKKGADEPRCVVCNPVQTQSIQSLLYPQQSQSSNNNAMNITFSQPLRGKKKTKTKTNTKSQSQPSVSSTLLQNVRERQQQNKSKLNEIDENKELKQLNEINDKLWNDDDQSYKKTEDASNKIGQLLLKGWTMLASHCDKCSTPMMRLRSGDPMCCICDSAQPEPKQTKGSTQSQSQPQIEEKKQQNDNINNNQQQRPQPRIGINGFDEQRRNNEYNAYDYYGMQRDKERERERPQRSEMSYYPPPPHPPYPQHPPFHHPPPPMFGLGPRQDEQMRRTIGDIVKTVLDKMSVINDRMSRNNGNITNDIQELNACMEFLQNVKRFKSQMRY